MDLLKPLHFLANGLNASYHGRVGLFLSYPGMSETRNALVAFGLCFAVLYGFNWIADMKRVREGAATTSSVISAHANVAVQEAAPKLSRMDALKASPRIKVKNEHVEGSVNLKGARLDDLSLTDYRETTEPESGFVELLNPSDGPSPYYAEMSWSSKNAVEMPDETTVWSLTPGTGNVLTPTSPVTLTWTNAQGIAFERTFSIDDCSMIFVTDRIHNPTGQPLSMTPSCVLVKAQHTERRTTSVHEGAIGILGETPRDAAEGTLKELSFEKLRKGKILNGVLSEGWVGFTDKYWLTSFVFKNSFISHVTVQGDEGLSRCCVTGPELTIAAQGSLEFKRMLFAGAKVLKTLDHYKAQGIKKFDLSVDFGWLYFFTKPVFYLLQFLYSQLGNLAVAIVLLTILSKAALFPMAQSSFRSMQKIKDLQPKMELIKRQFGSDRLRMNQELALLYRREKISPVSGIGPLLIQLPIFFCLYKVFAISIEMRHAPLGGWIHDLSAPDPTSLFNLFGLLPWTPPAFLQIGVLPLIMGGTMILQQKLSPQPADPAQAKMMYIMPLIFLFMFSSFPAGLVLYWTVSNILSIIQQAFLMKKMVAK